MGHVGLVVGGVVVAVGGGPAQFDDAGDDFSGAAAGSVGIEVG